MKWACILVQLFPLRFFFSVLLFSLLLLAISAASSDQPPPQGKTTTTQQQQFDQQQHRLKSPIATSSPSFLNSSSPIPQLSLDELSIIHHLLPTSLSLVADAPSAAAAAITTSRNAKSIISKSPPPPLHRINCRQLRMGQFLCPQAEIDPETQQPAGCTVANLAPVNCTLREGLICDDDHDDDQTRDLLEGGAPGKEVLNGANSTSTSTSKRKAPRYVSLAVACDYTNGYSFEVTLLLSVFLGFLGADRFYLGYGALGLLKLSTLGFLFLGHFVDILLIAMQIVLPADGSSYIIKQYGPRLNILRTAGGYPLPSPNASRVFESQYEHYFYWPANNGGGIGVGNG